MGKTLFLILIHRWVGRCGAVGVIGGWEKFQKCKPKKKRNAGGGRGENKVPKRKNRDHGEKNKWAGDGEKIKLQIKPEIKSDQGWEKGKQKKVNLGWHRDRKENRISAPSIHVGALVGAGALWPLRWWKPLASWPPFYLLNPTAFIALWENYVRYNLFNVTKKCIIKLSCN